MSQLAQKLIKQGYAKKYKIPFSELLLRTVDKTNLIYEVRRRGSTDPLAVVDYKSSGYNFKELAKGAEQVRNYTQKTNQNSPAVKKQAASLFGIPQGSVALAGLKGTGAKAGTLHYEVRDTRTNQVLGVFDYNRATGKSKVLGRGSGAYKKIKNRVLDRKEAKRPPQRPASVPVPPATPPARQESPVIPRHMTQEQFNRLTPQQQQSFRNIEQAQRQVEDQERQGNIQYAHTTGGRGRVHTVASGDTLSAIARRNGTTVQELMRLNPNITNADRINVGQRINVGTGTQQPTAQPQSNQYPITDVLRPSQQPGRTYRSEFHGRYTSPTGRTTTTQQTAPQQPTSTEHFIRSGETLSGIANFYGTTVDAIMAANPNITDRNRIRRGESIDIPRTQPQAPARQPSAPQTDRGWGQQNEFALFNPNSGISRDTSGLPSREQYVRNQQAVQNRRNRTAQNRGWTPTTEFAQQDPTSQISMDVSGLPTKKKYFENLRKAQERRDAKNNRGYFDWGNWFGEENRRRTIEGVKDTPRFIGDKIGGWFGGQEEERAQPRPNVYPGTKPSGHPGTEAVRPGSTSPFDTTGGQQPLTPTGVPPQDIDRLPPMQPVAPGTQTPTTGDGYSIGTGQNPFPGAPTHPFTHGDQGTLPQEEGGQPAINPPDQTGMPYTPSGWTPPQYKTIDEHLTKEGIQPTAPDYQTYSSSPLMQTYLTSTMTALQNAINSGDEIQQAFDQMYNKDNILKSGITQEVDGVPNLEQSTKTLIDDNPLRVMKIDAKIVTAENKKKNGSGNTMKAVTENTKRFESAIQRQENQWINSLRNQPTNIYTNPAITETYAQISGLYRELMDLKDAGGVVRDYIRDKGEGNISYSLLNNLTIAKSREVDAKIKSKQNEIDLATRILNAQVQLQDRADRLVRADREFYAQEQNRLRDDLLAGIKHQRSEYEFDVQQSPEERKLKMAKLLFETQKLRAQVAMYPDEVDLRKQGMDVEADRIAFLREELAYKRSLLKGTKITQTPQQMVSAIGTMSANQIENLGELLGLPQENLNDMLWYWNNPNEKRKYVNAIVQRLMLSGDAKMINRVMALAGGVPDEGEGYQGTNKYQLFPGWTKGNPTY